MTKRKDDKTTKEKRRPTWKKKIESPSGGLLAGGMTNIFKWCQAHDNSECSIGDPDRPNNVVWVTRRADFEKLQGTAANVVLQTRVTPGESETDLSSMFVGDLMADAVDRMKREPVPTKSTVQGVVDDVQKARQSGLPNAHTLGPAFEELQDFLKRLEEAEKKEQPIVEKREDVQFINIETPQGPTNKKARLKAYEDVKTILEPFDLHCCDEESDKKVVKAMETRKLPKVE